MNRIGTKGTCCGSSTGTNRAYHTGTPRSKVPSAEVKSAARFGCGPQSIERKMESAHSPHEDLKALRDPQTSTPEST